LATAPWKNLYPNLYPKLYPNCPYNPELRQLMPF
jgi:hypothetical protein